ncbi:putative proline-rich receptor-like protein kinase PERK3 [Iris pallida]|uniref:Proline-rich receptor-like protein kinase PERK3 n=1 Tax=Iris pallida TaxID=29817 RepID=A0AAX6FN89_IRIPA|nr:putative proline-rich receptor-like protein kinase PERK3 [Iris pallida]
MEVFCWGRVMAVVVMNSGGCFSSTVVRTEETRRSGWARSDGCDHDSGVDGGGG